MGDNRTDFFKKDEANFILKKLPQAHIFINFKD